MDYFIPNTLSPQIAPFYKTNYGVAYLCDSLRIMSELPDNSVNLVFTSPPYALHFKKEYGNVDKDQYISWFLDFASQIKRILTEDGSFVLNIGGSYNKGMPTRSIYHFKLLVALIEDIGFHLAQECFWFNPAKMPVPAEWVTVKRLRIKDSVEYVWWFSKTPWPKANNANVLKPYSQDMIRLNARGVKATVRPSGHNIKSSFDKIKAGGAIPPNVIEKILPKCEDDDCFSDLFDNFLKFGNNSSNDLYTQKCKEAGIKIHPARFPAALPEFFIKLLTSEDDIVLDPFAGSNTTGAVSEKLKRRWIAIENVEEYLEASKFRFDESLLNQLSLPLK